MGLILATRKQTGGVAISNLPLQNSLGRLVLFHAISYGKATSLHIFMTLFELTDVVSRTGNWLQLDQSLEL